MKQFETLKFDHTTTLQKEGMEISSYIAGVNSGAYQFPYIIQVRTWASKWGFKKFFYRRMDLNIYEVRLLKEELDKVIKWHDEQRLKDVGV